MISIADNDCTTGPKSRNRHWWRALIGIGTLVLVVIVSWYDYRWTVYLGQNNLSGFSLFMGQTFFEGDYPGGSDPAIVFFAFVLTAYIWVSRPSAAARFAMWRPYLGFVVVSGCVTAVTVGTV